MATTSQAGSPIRQAAFPRSELEEMMQRWLAANQSAEAEGNSAARG